jgi:hypothetical protein
MLDIETNELPESGETSKFAGDVTIKFPDRLLPLIVKVCSADGPLPTVYLKPVSEVIGLKTVAAFANIELQIRNAKIAKGRNVFFILYKLRIIVVN